MLSKIVIFSLSVGLFSFATLSKAEEVVLEAIVVATEFREKKLVEDSTSVSLISEDGLYDKSSQSFEEIVGHLPNVNFSSGASRAHYIQIRGIGERSQFTTALNPSIAIMLDGIDFSQSSLGVTLFDTKKIEVLKGPQGTTFGATGMAGVIHIESNEPTEELEGHIEATVGNYNTKSYGMSLSGTVIEDRLRARASVYEHRSDGYMRNSFLHRDDTQKIDELTAKLQLAWRVSDEHLIDFAFRHLDITNGYDAFSLDNSRTSHADEIGIDAQRTNAFAIKSNYQMNEAMHLVSKLSHSQSNLVYAYDEDWSYIGEFPEQFSPYSAFDSYKREKIQNDIDIKLMGDAEGRIFDDSTDWTLGFYCKKYKEKLLREYSYFEKPFSSTYDTSNTVVYGQFDTAIDDKMVLVSGLRLESWNAKYSDSQELNIENDEVLVGGKLGLSYEENSQTLYYAYLSKGYKPGGVNADSRLITDAKSYYTENLWNLELGINSSYLEDTLINRFNIFYGKREDQQVKSSIVSTREDGSQNFIGYLANAGKSHYYGLESQMDWYLSERIHFYSSIGLLQSTFDTYIDPNPLALNVEGRTPAHSPEYQYVIGFDMTFWEGWIWKSNLEAKGAYYFSNRHDEKSDAYTLVHSSLEYTIGNWSVVAWIRNITNIDYQTRGFGSFGNNPSNGYEVERYTQQGTPRTAGLTLSYDF